MNTDTTKRGRGRPSRSSMPARCHIRVRVTENEMSIIEKDAAERGMNVSDFVRSNLLSTTAEPPCQATRPSTTNNG